MLARRVVVLLLAVVILFGGCILKLVGPGDLEQLRADSKRCYLATHNQYGPTGSSGVDIAGELLNDAANTAAMDKCMKSAGWERIGQNVYRQAAL
jgi:hypothetical protein